jgi:uncharacterized CHY-type Zn-finger protein
MEAHALNSTKKAEVDCVCDLCGRITLHEFIVQTQGQISLCPACYKHINPMPDGIIKNSIMRFLRKNVL